MSKGRGKNPYKAHAVKVKIAGHKKIELEEDVHEYASRLEARCAEVLIKHEVRFKPHVKFNCVDREGKPFTYEVDFLFEEPKKFLGISEAIDAIEVKGVLSRHDFLRRTALKFKHGIDAYIALEPIIQLWENEGVR